LERLETAEMPSGLKVVVEGPGRVDLGPAGAEIELSQTGRHYVVGDKGNDIVRAGDGGDRIELGAGNDTIVGGRGNDTMVGGSGADRFVFAPGGGHDVIKDWNAVDDVIFEGYGAGATFTSKLVSGGLLLSLSDDQSILLSGITSKVLSPSDVDWI
jgi:Ca2+-binding RTX toxin-like protein